MAIVRKSPPVKPGQIALKPDQSAAVPAIYANSYNVLFEKGMVRVNFACLSAGQLLKGATVFLPEEMIFSNKDETVEYFNQMNDVTADEPTPFYSEKFDVFYGQIFAFSRSGRMSETNPLFIRLNLLATATGSVACTASVSINMPIEAQLGIVKAIYINDWSEQKNVMKQINIPKSAHCLLAFPLAIGMLPSESSKADFYGSEETVSAYQGNIPISISISEKTISSAQRITFQAAPKPLSYAEEVRFHKLAIKEALGTISSLDRRDLEILDGRRTVDKSLPPETIIARERLYSKIDQLLKKLDRFGA